MHGATTAEAPSGVEVAVMQPTRHERWTRHLRRFELDTAALAAVIAEAARGCDIVHVHWSSGIGRAAALGARLAKRPLVAEVRFDLAGAVVTESLYSKATWLEQALRRRFEAHVTDAAAVVAASHTLAILLERDCRVSRDRLSVVPNGVDLPAEPAEDPSIVRARLGLNGATVIGTTSNMLRYENLEAILEVAARLPSAHALFVGDGPVRRELERRARLSGVAFTFAGRVPPSEVPGYLGAMDIFAVPRRSATITRYASPIKVVEAMAMGRAVVATALGDVPNLLGDGERGLLVPPGNPAAFVAAVGSLANDPERRSALGMGARAHAVHELSWDGAVQRYSSIYNRLA